MDAPCGKRSYPSKLMARYACRMLGARIRVYFCKACRAWHVTNHEKA